MDDLITRLRAAIDGQQARAEDYRLGDTRAASDAGEELLRMVAAYRKILDLHTAEGGECVVCHGEAEMQEHYDSEAEQETVTWESDRSPYPCATVLAVAEGYGIVAA